MAKGSLERQKLTNEKVSLPDDEMSTQISGLTVGRRDGYVKEQTVVASLVPKSWNFTGFLQEFI